MNLKLIFAVAIFCLASAVDGKRNCKGVVVQSVCYYVGMSRYGYTKEQAETSCEDEGGSLATIPTLRAFDGISFYLLNDYSMQMILTGLEYDHDVSAAKPLLPSGQPISYKPNWFEGHPITRELHGEIVYIPNRKDKFNGFMNVADGARYRFFLCAN